MLPFKKKLSMANSDLVRDCEQALSDGINIHYHHLRMAFTKAVHLNLFWVICLICDLCLGLPTPRFPCGFHSRELLAML